MTPDTRFGISFWIAVIVLTAGTVGCFGYAEMQLHGDERPTDQKNDTHLIQPRSLLSFERTL